MFVRPLALYLALTTLPAIAQNNFTITVRDKPAGKASYTIEKTKDGYHVKTKLSYHLSPQPHHHPTPTRPRPRPLLLRSRTCSRLPVRRGLQTRRQQQLRRRLHHQHGDTGQHLLQHQQVSRPALHLPESGRIRRPLNSDCHQAKLRPASRLRPSALQALLLQTVVHPTEKDLYLVLVPGKNPGEDAVPALWLTNQPDPHGTLDGKPLTLHHFILRLYKSQYDLVADDTNTLMMASSTNLSAIYTRDGFVLTSIK
jgi:hypothetical protein